MSVASHGASRKACVLPTEVCERIIDFVAEEVPYAARISMWEDHVFKTLQACALTCRAWTPRSQLHLFRFLGVDCTRGGKRPLSEFYDFIDRHRPLQAYAEALLARADDYKTTSMHVLPIRIPHLLPTLRHLQLIKGVLYHPRSQFFQVTMRQFKTVSELVLYKIAFHSVHDLRRIASGLPKLQSLSITCASWQQPSTAPVPTSYPSTPVRLTMLRIDSEAEWAQDKRSVYFIEWMTESGMLTSLVAAYLGCLMIQEHTLLLALNKMLRACCNTLREIGLSWSTDLELEVSSLGCMLSRCHRLQDLEFYLPYQATAMVHLTSLLSKMTETKCFVLRLNFERYPHVDALPLEPSADNWSLLDDILQSSEWKSLSEVGVDRNVLRVEDDATFAWGNTYHWEPWGAEVLEKWRVELRGFLPLTFKQGKLRYDLDKDATWVPLS